MARGLLILVEGLDRTGKSTQASILLDKLKPNAELVKFPDRTTPIGQLINRYLTDESFQLPDQSIHLLFSANRWELSQSLQNTLLSGKHVIMDRYVYSGIAYSLAKGIDGMDFDWCIQPDKGLIKPDLLFFLSNRDSLDTASREGFGQERYESLAFQEKVRDQFYRVLERLENYSQGTDSNRLQMINVTNQSIDQVSITIWEIVNRKLQNEPPTDFAFF
ncbi:hypothetical protein ZYGR_0Z01850 [Zygosaccharomyces rouxii]|uniref:Thymidylate kinase n=2 Tax=Zygosaccharomyces rouxii TaxID=4956 RepID=C5DZH9_ZYGRC|nr:uncharacterized protein ZYRO0G04554g [Zygosaccharomyces rouxii]KAH9202262.1 P-loop containing nucleoside triphosphate hydrolase protein [Zygosaccharomyces rouxii]GAV50762.1 hypothetical protein ZYGR_0Z01850 [Zygosaccharomyces rouxii]CAR29263.1 ZYRO0G04554p [Zygosaccharomyces rouxii]